MLLVFPLLGWTRARSGTDTAAVRSGNTHQNKQFQAPEIGFARGLIYERIHKKETFGLLLTNYHAYVNNYMVNSAFVLFSMVLLCPPRLQLLTDKILDHLSRYSFACLS